MSDDNLINKLLVGALQKLAVNSFEVVKTQELLNYFSEVTDYIQTNGTLELKKIQFSKETESFREVLTLAAMIIDNVDYSNLGRKSGVESFLLNFDDLFEKFVIKVLFDIESNNLFSTWETKQLLSSKHNLNNRLFYQPDILFDYNQSNPNKQFKSTAYSVIDVKNKAYGIFKSADIYQVLTYAKALSSEKAILVYPSFYERPNETVTFDYELFNPSKVTASFINISENSGDSFLNSIKRFQNSFIDLLQY